MSDDFSHKEKTIDYVHLLPKCHFLQNKENIYDHKAPFVMLTQYIGQHTKG